MQFYTGNFLDGSARGKGATYVQHAALCLETQKFPNAINVPAWRDQVILRPGQTYRHVMVHSVQRRAMNAHHGFAPRRSFEANAHSAITVK